MGKISRPIPIVLSLLLCGRVYAAGQNNLLFLKEPSMNTQTIYIGYGKTKHPVSKTSVYSVHPEQWLMHFLHLADGSRSLAEITPERLAHVFGVPREQIFFEDDGGYRLVQSVNDRWMQSVRVSLDAQIVRLNFLFDSDKATGVSASDYQEVCGMGLEAFINHARHLGFQMETDWDKGVVLQEIRLKKGNRLLRLDTYAAPCIDRVILVFGK